MIRFNEVYLLRFYVILVLLAYVLSSAVYAQTSGQSPTATNTDEQLANQYFREGQYDKAAVLYEELFAKRPTAISYNNLLICLIELQDFRKAERLVNGQIRLHPEQVRYRVDLGYVMERSLNSRQARRHFDGLLNGLRANPQNVSGNKGGKIVAQGSPKDVAKNNKSITGKYLKRII